MLTDLTIKNFAIIEALHVPFQPGLNVLTGETGAGKSIIIDAVSLILGGRASADLIRTGEDDAVVEALFDVSSSPSISAVLAEGGIDCYGEVLVKRMVSRSGRNRVFINGALSTLAALGNLAGQLINIYGQHESQTLLRPENHLKLLDGFAELHPHRTRFAAIYEEFRRTAAELAELDEGEREAERRLDLLNFQSGEIADAALRPGEDDDLLRERQVLSHAEKLMLHAQRAYEALYGGDESLLGQLQQVSSDVDEITAIDTALGGIGSVLKDASFQLEDVALGLRKYAAGIEADPERLRGTEDRLDLIGRLKKKYGATIEDILDYRQRVDQEREQLLNREASRDEKVRILEQLRLKMATQGEELTRLRQAAAVRLQEAMETELRQLAMQNALFRVSLTPLTEPKATGLERAEFLFSPNPGEEPRPLAKIASGGELSRLMLAFKQIHPESDVPTLVFDEVDTGIGGATSALVGEKLKRVAAAQQVLCITHLPQVAAFADHHYRVEKRVEAGRTVTSIVLLRGEERVSEMARMLGGLKITDTTLEHAREMIQTARTQ